MEGTKYRTLQCRGPVGELEKDVGVAIVITPTSNDRHNAEIHCPYYREFGCLATPSEYPGKFFNGNFADCIFKNI